MHITTRLESHMNEADDFGRHIATSMLVDMSEMSDRDNKRRYSDELADRERLVGELRQKMVDMEREIETLRTATENHDTQMDTKQNEIQTLGATIDERKDQIAAKECKIQALMTTINEREDQVIVIKDLRETIARVRTEMTRKDTKIQRLQEAIDNHQDEMTVKEDAINRLHEAAQEQMALVTLRDGQIKELQETVRQEVTDRANQPSPAQGVSIGALLPSSSRVEERQATPSALQINATVSTSSSQRTELQREPVMGNIPSSVPQALDDSILGCSNADIGKTY
ncbi:hypothetical protein K491DRAFT_165411 [Lophiostoma macrostomum CBS 122681]|uniref:Uncharacterized protein n=1 Tax=Lophiostoma macrostomum CBS 122681 TaxID=1314788 RepID=A0A6A6THR5_9PLEO|nr:hypothetical protein K491DRAFT_165411 [Lophiostoma macrostomum CBS 122681]